MHPAFRGLVAVGLAVVAAMASAAGGEDGSAAEHFGIRQVKEINDKIGASWSEAGLQPSAEATDGEFSFE